MLAQAVEELRHGGELHLRALERVHARAEDRRVLQPLGVPAYVLAGHAHAALHAIEGIEVVHVSDQHLADLGDLRRRQVLAGGEEVRDLAEDPRAALGRAPDHHRVGAGVVEHEPGLLRGGDVAVGDHGNRN